MYRILIYSIIHVKPSACLVAQKKERKHLLTDIFYLKQSMTLRPPLCQSGDHTGRTKKGWAQPRQRGKKELYDILLLSYTYPSFKQTHNWEQFHRAWHNVITKSAWIPLLFLTNERNEKSTHRGWRRMHQIRSWPKTLVLFLTLKTAKYSLIHGQCVRRQAAQHWLIVININEQTWEVDRQLNDAQLGPSLV